MHDGFIPEKEERKRWSDGSFADPEQYPFRLDPMSDMAPYEVFELLLIIMRNMHGDPEGAPLVVNENFMDQLPGTLHRHFTLRNVT